MVTNEKVSEAVKKKDLLQQLRNEYFKFWKK
jgi:hypothetical protein